MSGLKLTEGDTVVNICVDDTEGEIIEICVVSLEIFYIIIDLFTFNEPHSADFPANLCVQISSASVFLAAKTLDGRDSFFVACVKLRENFR